MMNRESGSPDSGHGPKVLAIEGAVPLPHSRGTRSAARRNDEKRTSATESVSTLKHEITRQIRENQSHGLPHNGSLPVKDARVHSSQIPT